MGMENHKAFKLKLSLSATKLRNVASIGRGVSDPFAVVTLLSTNKDKPVILGRTETIKNDLNPSWTTTFSLEFELGKPQYINIGIYDEFRTKNDKLMGSAAFEIGDILGSKENVKVKKLKPGGSLYARVEQAAKECADVLRLKLQGVDLKNVEGFFGGKSDPFYELATRVDGSSGCTWRTVIRSKHIKNNLNPTWDDETITLDDLCNRDIKRPVLISVFDHEKSGKHTSMGSFETTVESLIHASGSEEGFKLRKKGKEYGLIRILKCRIDSGNRISTSITSQMETCRLPATSERLTSVSSTSGSFVRQNNRANMRSSTSLSYVPHSASSHISSCLPVLGFYRPTFVDYISGACELNMCVAIDFTGSNGDPRVPGTLHYIYNDGRLNDYEKAIIAVGSIVAKYDSDQMFPVWGFGAKFDGVLHNCFQIGPTAEQKGVNGILEAYRSVFKSPIVMSSPSEFGEVIRTASVQAMRQQELSRRIGQQSYTILLILTDGIVSNIDATKAAIVDASNAPLSIVIVGIGRADFGAMRFLDEFGEGSNADICQFVEFETHKDNRVSLTRETLDEIPNQLVNYFYTRGIMPLPAPAGSMRDTNEEASNDLDVDLALKFDDRGSISFASNYGTYVDVSYGTSAQYNGLSLPSPLATAANRGDSSYIAQSSTPIAQVYPTSFQRGVTAPAVSPTTLQGSFNDPRSTGSSQPLNLYNLESVPLYRGSSYQSPQYVYNPSGLSRTGIAPISTASTYLHSASSYGPANQHQAQHTSYNLS